MNKIGTREQVMLGRARQTKSGLTKDDLFFDRKSKTIKSKLNSLAQRRKYYNNHKVQNVLRRSNEKRRIDAVIRKQNEKREVERRFGAPEPPHRRVSSRNPFETLKIPTSGPIVDVKYERVGGHRPEGKRIESEVRLPSFLR